MVEIRRMEKRFFERVDAILMAGFCSQESRIDAIRCYVNIQPDGFYTAFLDGEPVGTVGAVGYGSFAYIGLMVVHPEHQRKGIGRSLMAFILNWIDQRGVPASILDATAAGAPLYEKMNFVDDGFTDLYVLERTPVDLAESSYVRPASVKDVPEMVSLDHRIFGADRSRVFDSFLKDAPGRAWIYRDEGGDVKGFLFAQRNKIGPWTASSIDSARALLCSGLKLPDTPPIEVNMPSPNSEGARLLMEFGFRLERHYS